MATFQVLLVLFLIQLVIGQEQQSPYLFYYCRHPSVTNAIINNQSISVRFTQNHQGIQQLSLIVITFFCIVSVK